MWWNNEDQPSRLHVGPRVPYPTGWCTTPSNNESISTFSTCNNYTAMASIYEAIEDLEVREAKHDFSLQGVVKRYSVSHSTLNQRWNYQTGSWAAEYATQQLLSSQQEERLVKYIGGLTACGLPPTRVMIQNFASILIEKAR
jgi:hypothetical protein